MAVTAKNFISTFSSRAVGALLHDALIEKNGAAVDIVLSELAERREFKLIEKIIDNAFDAGFEFKHNSAIRIVLEKAFSKHRFEDPFIFSFYRFLTSGEYDSDYMKSRYEMICKSEHMVVETFLSAITPKELAEMSGWTFSALVQRLVDSLEYEEPQLEREELKELAYRDIRSMLERQIVYLAEHPEMLADMKQPIRAALKIDERRQEMLDFRRQSDKT